MVLSQVLAYALSATCSAVVDDVLLMGVALKVVRNVGINTAIVYGISDTKPYVELAYLENP